MTFQTAIDHDKYHKFFDNFLQKSEISKTDCQLVAVLHVLPDVVPFYRAIAAAYELTKRSYENGIASVDNNTRDIISKIWIDSFANF